VEPKMKAGWRDCEGVAGWRPGAQEEGEVDGLWRSGGVRPEAISEIEDSERGDIGRLGSAWPQAVTSPLGGEGREGPSICSRVE
jgi:hypothetical protein